MIMLSYASEMATNAQARLDEEIAQLVIMLSGLKTQKNALAPVSRLPTSILARAFVYYARDDHHRNPCYTSGSMKSRWICVSFVCRHWRHVALTCPALWSYLFVASRRWTETLLARSLDSPLRISVYLFKRDEALDFMARVSLHTERLQECCLHFFELTLSDVARALSMLSSRAAPLLRILKITIKPLETDTDSGKHEQDQAFNEDILFNGDTPMLHELELTIHNVPWCSPTFDALTTLWLWNLAASVQLTTAQLKAVLGRTPDLEQLHLENALRSGPPSSGQATDKLHLASLTRLLIIAPLSEIVTLLSYVNIPLTALIRLRCSQETHPSADDFNPFCSFLSEWSGASTNKVSSMIPLRAIGMKSWGNAMDFIFSASKASCEEHMEGMYISEYDCDTPLAVEFRPWPPFPEGTDDIAAVILQSLPLVHLKSIAMDACRFSSTIWVDTFWHLQELRSIKLIFDDGFSDLLETLSIPSRSPQSNIGRPKGRGRRQVFAPSLKQLVLHDVSLTNEARLRLCHVLAQRRRQAGRALERLEFVNCLGLDEGDVKELAKEVGVVRWDGRVSGKRGEDWDDPKL